jgi:Y_Y_Y domain
VIKLFSLLTGSFYCQIAFSQSKIDSIIVDGEKKEFFLDSPFEIKALQNEVVFHLQKSNLDSNRYHFYLQGFDRQWLESDHNQIRYTNLTGGSYTFLWKINNEKQQSLAIEVERSLTEEWWFLPLLIFYIEQEHQ